MQALPLAFTPMMLACPAGSAWSARLGCQAAELAVCLAAELAVCLAVCLAAHDAANLFSPLQRTAFAFQRAGADGRGFRPRRCAAWADAPAGACGPTTRRDT